MKPDGTLDRSSVSVTRAIDGENVALSGSKFLGLGAFTLSGNFEGNTLTLSGGLEPTAFPFKRASLRDYQAKVVALDEQAKSILAARTAAENKRRADVAAATFVAQINQLVSNMEQFDSEADLHLGRFPSVENGYRAITAKVAGYVDRERQVPSGLTASVARSQLSVAATQASFATDQLHNQGTELQSTLEVNVKPTADQVNRFGQLCGITTPGLSPDRNEERNLACNRLSNAAPTFHQKYAATTNGLTHLEQVYQQEHDAQQKLLQTAQKLE